MAVALGIVGFGIMGERLLRAALAHDPAVLRAVAVWDPSPAAAARLAEVAPGLPMLGSAAEVIAACDALYIASPPSSHIPHAEAALAAGRAVFLEKPLAANLAEARRFVAAAEAAGARAAVNFPMASSPAVARLRAWQPGLGAAKAVSIEVGFAAWPRAWQAAAASWLDGAAEGGFTREVVSHFLFLTRRLLGPLWLRDAFVHRPDPARAETVLRAGLLAGGVAVSLRGQVGGVAAEDTNEWRLWAEHGAMRLRDWSVAERAAMEGGALRAWQADPAALPNPQMRPLVLRGQLDKLAALTRGQAVDLATLREALEVQEVVEAMLAG